MAQPHEFTGGAVRYPRRPYSAFPVPGTPPVLRIADGAFGTAAIGKADAAAQAVIGLPGAQTRLTVGLVEWTAGRRGVTGGGFWSKIKQYRTARRSA